MRRRKSRSTHSTCSLPTAPSTSAHGRRHQPQNSPRGGGHLLAAVQKQRHPRGLGLVHQGAQPRQLLGGRHPRRCTPPSGSGDRQTPRTRLPAGTGCPPPAGAAPGVADPRAAYRSRRSSKRAPQTIATCTAFSGPTRRSEPLDSPKRPGAAAPEAAVATTMDVDRGRFFGYRNGGPGAAVVSTAARPTLSEAEVGVLPVYRTGVGDAARRVLHAGR